MKIYMVSLFHRATINQAMLLFWKKMYTNNNVLLYILSRYASVPSRFMAVASQYGIHWLQQTVGTVKFCLVTKLDSFFSVVCCLEVFCKDSCCLERVYFVLFSVLYFCLCVLCVLCLHFTLLPSGVMK